MTNGRRTRGPVSRRALLRAAGLAGIGLAAGRRDADAATALGVLSTMPPNPAPPGVAPYGAQAFNAWKARHNAYVQYDPIDWPQYYRRLSTYFDDGESIYDVVYTAGWIPEFHQYFKPVGESVAPALEADMPASAFTSATWQGQIYGYPATLSLLTLFVNEEHLASAGLSSPPSTWEELKTYSRELTRDGRAGWVANLGMPSGIGGTATYWMAFLQQAGGTMYGEDGLPVFNDAPGVDALQLMIDLMPFTHKDAAQFLSIVDATNAFIAGEASMMMNWPFMWAATGDRELSKVAGSVRTAVLPAGPAGTASIDGADAWSITANSRHPELAQALIAFYLDRDVQRQQALSTGWLPVRLSVLKDPAVQEALPHAATVLAQARHPYNSFLTPDYEAITDALGTEIQRALQGQQSAADALAAASDAVTEIVKRRS